MPSGGAKDIAAPKLESSFPTNKQTNFFGNEISLKFDEFIELESPQKNIFVSPYTNQILDLYIVGKKVFVHFPDGLKQNTTYSIQFNKAIKDFTEGNVLQELELNFSTGKNLDSGKYAVNIVSAKEKTNNELTVVALVKNKSDFFGKNYNYIAKINNGIASFNNLNKDEYTIYAFADSNQNLKWDKNEPIAFSKNKVKQGQASEKMYLFPSIDSNSKLIVTQKSPNEYDIYSPKEIMILESLDPDISVHQLGLHLFKLITKKTEEEKIILVNINKVKTPLRLIKTESRKTIELIDKENNRGLKLKRNDSLILNLNAFISKIDTSKIRVRIGETRVPIKTNYYNNQLIITGLDYKQTYSLEIDSQAIWSLGLYNKQINQTITTYPKENHYSEIVIKLDTNILNKKVAIYLMKENKLMPINLNKEIKLLNIFGNNLEFHLIIDENNNGFWDSGDVIREIQPEKYYIESIKLEPGIKEYNLKMTKM